jgi:hypothetical protein
MSYYDNLQANGMKKDLLSCRTEDTRYHAPSKVSTVHIDIEKLRGQFLVWPIVYHLIKVGRGRGHSMVYGVFIKYVKKYDIKRTAQRDGSS